jgi:hypothetical protein
MNGHNRILWKRQVVQHHLAKRCERVSQAMRNLLELLEQNSVLLGQFDRCMI